MFLLRVNPVSPSESIRYLPPSQSGISLRVNPVSPSESIRYLPPSQSSTSLRVNPVSPFDIRVVACRRLLSHCAHDAARDGSPYRHPITGRRCGVCAQHEHPARPCGHPARPCGHPARPCGHPARPCGHPSSAGIRRDGLPCHGLPRAASARPSSPRMPA